MHPDLIAQVCRRASPSKVCRHLLHTYQHVHPTRTLNSLSPEPLTYVVYLPSNQPLYPDLKAQVLVPLGPLDDLLRSLGRAAPLRGEGLRLLRLPRRPRARRVERRALQETLLVGEDPSAERLGGLVVRSFVLRDNNKFSFFFLYVYIKDMEIRL